MARAPVVLVVEDDFDIATLVSEILEAEGFEVATARNGRIGLELLRARTPDVVVLDLMMPELDGFGFLAGWRELPEPRPFVLACSAFEGYLPMALTHGASAVLRKPFSLDDLVATVWRAVRGGAAEPAGPVLPEAPQEEERRLRSVLELRLDAPSPTAAMDQFVRCVALIFDVPVCLVSIVTLDRQAWHAFCGLPPDLEHARGTPRSDSFCTHAVVAKAALIVQDARENPLFAANVLVRDRGLRFYAGVPVANRVGEVMGTVCLLDFKPRGFGLFDLELLSVLARRVAAEMEWREKRRRPELPAAAFRYLHWLDEELDVLGREAFVQGLQVSSLRAAEQRRGLALGVLEVEAERLAVATAALKAAFPSALLGRLGSTRLGVLVPDVSGEALREGLHAAAPGSADTVAVSVPRIAGGADQFLHQAEVAVGLGRPRAHGLR